mgnify:CR=1 FL=1
MGRIIIPILAIAVTATAIIAQQRYQAQESAMVTVVMNDGREVIIRSSHGQDGMMQIGGRTRSVSPALKRWDHRSRVMGAPLNQESVAAVPPALAYRP